ncbi:hypothetical protein GCM10025759_24630 [Lysobacter panacisoli]|uniref:Uncharacterized protein n=1 Tax=Lysobacter panacisoli TaxID=1255263 RepID=A0ABP9LGF7_9GAMM
MEKRIDLGRLQFVVNAIFEHFKGRSLECVTIDEDFYWELDVDSLFNTSERPEAAGLGSLVDDWGFVQAASADPSQAVGLLLSHVAPLLTYLAIREPQ